MSEGKRVWVSDVGRAGKRRREPEATVVNYLILFTHVVLHNFCGGSSQSMIGRSRSGRLASFHGTHETPSWRSLTTRAGYLEPIRPHQSGNKHRSKEGGTDQSNVQMGKFRYMKLLILSYRVYLPVCRDGCRCFGTEMQVEQFMRGPCATRTNPCLQLQRVGDRCRLYLF
jgi:hypothetical protein